MDTSTFQFCTTPVLADTVRLERLHHHRERLTRIGLKGLFGRDPERFEHMHVRAAGLLLDYSKNLMDAAALQELIALAEAAGLARAIPALLDGAPLNHTEKRMALHTALRMRDDELPKAIASEVISVRERMLATADRIRAGQWQGHTGKTIDTIVNIGVGGSDLGPMMAVHALKDFASPSITLHFVSNIDPAHISQTLAHCNPATTLFIVASKTFTTLETLANAHAARQWLLAALNDEQAVSRHFLAVSVNLDATSRFGIQPENVFPMWDWVGGRYSLWSSIGMSIAIAIGSANFRAFLDGGRAMDLHFRTAPLMANMPVLLGLLGVWHVNVLQAQSQAIIAYDQNLLHFPTYLQQLDMESNGKSVQRNGQPVGWQTGVVLWGGVGTNTQHSFHQLFHQGTPLVPVDFLVGMENHHPVAQQQAQLFSNCLAQSQAMMLGRDLASVQAEMRSKNIDEATIATVAPHRVIPGNKPSNTIVYQKISPAVLGALIALYEHKVFVQSVIWNINPFDQWGVELGKQMSHDILDAMQKPDKIKRLDASTQALVNLFLERQS